MDAATLSELRKPRSYPAVSVLMPTARKAPQNREDPIRLRNLLAEVRRRLRDDDRVPSDTAADVLRGLEEAAAEIDPRHAADGLVLFAAPGEHHAFTLDQPVTERVIVDSGFATRDLVAEHTRARRYWLLVLSDRRSRLWDMRGGDLTEVTAHGFPVVPEEIDEEAEGRRSPRHGHADERHRKLIREVLDGLGAVLARERRPVIVAGVTRAQAFFDEQAGPEITIAGRIDGGYEGTQVPALAELARPVVQAYEDLREVTVLAELEAARGLQRYASGLEGVLKPAEDGRGEHLVVERGYYSPAVRGDDGETIPVEGPLGSLKGAGVVDDVVDDVIETVLEYGGEVTFVSDGFLIDHDRIALVTRF